MTAIYLKTILWSRQQSSNAASPRSTPQPVPRAFYSPQTLQVIGQFLLMLGFRHSVLTFLVGHRKPALSWHTGGHVALQSRVSSLGPSSWHQSPFLGGGLLQGLKNERGGDRRWGVQGNDVTAAPPPPPLQALALSARWSSGQHSSFFGICA